MSRSDLLPDSAPRDDASRTRPVFGWAFAACVALPLVGAALLMLGGSFESAGSGLGIYALVLSPVLWVGVLLGGLAMRVSGRAARGNSMMLGALAGAVVGFSLCSGAFVVLGGVL